MNKKYFYIIFAILLLISIPILKENNKSITINGVNYALSIDGEKVDSFPTKSSYDVVVECSEAIGTWDYENWIVKISDITGEVACDISFESKSQKNLNRYIKDTLTGTTQGTGQVVNEKGYRYEGKNPNNYIKFNNELWRIIGVFDSSSHGQAGQYLTKIIRNDSIGGHSYDKSSKNTWSTSSLYKLLNTYYYNSTNGQESGECYRDSTILEGFCDYTNIGIKDEYRPMIKNVTWYLGGYSDAYDTTTNFYAYERSTNDTYYSSSNKSYKTATGYIGLMYASDYGYSPLSSSCARTTELGVYNTDACAGSSWMFREYTEWIITPTDSVWQFFLSVNLNNYYTDNPRSVRPVLYLDSSVYILSGTGTQADPYIIGMN